jgi:hypothetical protein
MRFLFRLLACKLDTAKGFEARIQSSPAVIVRGKLWLLKAKE